MNVLSVAAQDTGGQAIRIKQAFDRHAPGWSVRSIVKRSSYAGYPTDLPWRRPVVDHYWRQADVLHLHNGFGLVELAGRHLAERPMLTHYHGSAFRTRPDQYLLEQRRRRALGLVSTLDLWLIAPDELEWLPAPFDLDWLASLRRPRNDGRIRIAHAPTHRGIKSTEAFLAACRALQAEGYPLDVELIELQRWDRCLALKAKADIFFDQVTLGYGNNAIEAWGMGIPVIAGVNAGHAAAFGQSVPDGVLAEMERRFGSLPFYQATATTLREAIAALTESPELRATYAQRGLDHVRTWHDEKRVVAQLQDVYQRTAEVQTGRSPAWLPAAAAAL